MKLERKRPDLRSMRVYPGKYVRYPDVMGTVYRVYQNDNSFAICATRATAVRMIRRHALTSHNVIVRVTRSIKHGDSVWYAGQYAQETIAKFGIDEAARCGCLDRYVILPETLYV